MPRLIIDGVAHELIEDVVTIGRAPDNLIHLDDPSISSRHAEVHVEESRYELRDVGSTNGTFVNGQAVSATNLRPGDRVRFGRVETRFESDGTGAVQPLPELEAADALPADASALPNDFRNASPFPVRGRDKDSTQMAVLAAAAIAAVAFVASMIAVALMDAPVL